MPELTADEINLEDLRSHPELVDLIMSAVFPSARHESLIASAFLPFDLRSFYETSPFMKLKILEKFLNSNRIHGSKVDTEEMMRGKTMSAYHRIVSQFYQIDIYHDIPFVVELPEEETGLNQYYRVLIDPTFVTLKTNGQLPELNEEDRRRLLADPMNLELWMQILPPERFEFHGFVVMTAVDVTQQEVLSKLKNELLVKEAMTDGQNLDRLERNLQELLFRPDLKLGLIALDRCRTGCVTGARTIGRSLLLHDQLPICDNWKESYYAKAIDTGELVFVDDLTEAELRTGFEEHLINIGYKTLFLAPLHNREEVVGVLELASPNCCDITAMHGLQLHEVSTLFATAINRRLEEQEDQVQAIIKKQYTAIHPVVEWRFREAALNRLFSDNGDEAPEVEGISFSDVHPLYGMSDIRGSSEYRSDAIREDLSQQLGLALAVIIAASVVRPRPSLDELGYRLSRYIEELVAGTRSGDERTLILFLQTEVEPLFARMESYSDDVAEKIRTYSDAVDQSLGVIYRKRKAFEDSVASINETISAFLDRKEEEAQNMTPHYFEKYMTDGVEYNIYAGSSLLENGQFDDLDLKNLKLW